MMNKKMRVSLLFVGLFMNGHGAADKLSFGLNWKPEPQFGGFYEAQRSGEFEKAGLTVELIPGGSGTPIPQLVAQGKLPYGVVSGEEIIINNVRNTKNPLIGLFSVYHTNPRVIICQKELGFKSVSDIFAAEIILAAEAGQGYMGYYRAKYPKAKAKIVPYSGGVAPFLSGAHQCQQGFLTSEPLLIRKANRPADIFFVADDGYNPYMTVVVTQADRLKSNPAEVQKMLAALKMGWESYLKDPAPANRIMSKANPGMDFDTMQESAKDQKMLIQSKSDEPVGSMSLKRWQEIIEATKRAGIIASSAQIEASSLFLVPNSESLPVTQ